jgi:hypothetical protein
LNKTTDFSHMLHAVAYFLMVSQLVSYVLCSSIPFNSEQVSGYTTVHLLIVSEVKEKKGPLVCRGEDTNAYNHKHLANGNYKHVICSDLKE